MNKNTTLVCNECSAEFDFYGLLTDQEREDLAIMARLRALGIVIDPYAGTDSELQGGDDGNNTD